MHGTGQRREVRFQWRGVRLRRRGRRCVGRASEMNRRTRRADLGCCGRAGRAELCWAVCQTRHVRGSSPRDQMVGKVRETGWVGPVCGKGEMVAQMANNRLAI